MAELTRLQQDIINFYHQNPFTEYIQAKVIPTAGGGVRLELTVEAEHTNLYGIVHGGVLMTLAVSGKDIVVKDQSNELKRMFDWQDCGMNANLVTLLWVSTA